MRVHVVWKNLHDPRYGCLHPSQPFAGDYRHGSIRDQKQIRLQAARARVLADDLDAATVVFEVGYESATKSIVNTVACSANHLFVNIKALRLPNLPRLESITTASQVSQ